MAIAHGFRRSRDRHFDGAAKTTSSVIHFLSFLALGFIKPPCAGHYRRALDTPRPTSRPDRVLGEQFRGNVGLRFAPVALQGGRLGGSLIMRSVVITGASTGIGWATAKLLLARGFRVFGSVRKPADADRLKTEFGANFVPLSFDVTDEAALLPTADHRADARGCGTLAGPENQHGTAHAGHAPARGDREIHPET